MFLVKFYLFFKCVQIVVCTNSFINDSDQESIENFIINAKNQNGMEIIQELETFLERKCSIVENCTFGEIILNNENVQHSISTYFFGYTNFPIYIFNQVKELNERQFVDTKLLKTQIKLHLKNLTSTQSDIILNYITNEMLPILNDWNHEFYGVIDLNSTEWVQRTVVLTVVNEIDKNIELTREDVNFIGSLLSELLFIPTSDYQDIYKIFVIPVTIAYIRTNDVVLNFNNSILFEKAFEWYLNNQLSNHKDPVREFYKVLQTYQTRSQIGESILTKNNISLVYLEDYKNLGSYDGILKNMRNSWNRFTNLFNLFSGEYLHKLEQINKLETLPNLNLEFENQNKNISFLFGKVDSLLLSHCLTSFVEFDFIAKSIVISVEVDFTFYPALNGLYMGYSQFKAIPPLDQYILPKNHFLFAAIEPKNKEYRIFGFIQNNKTKHYTLQRFSQNVYDDFKQIEIFELNNSAKYEQLFRELKIVNGTFKILTFNLELGSNVIKSENDTYDSIIKEVSVRHQNQFQSDLQLLGFNATLTDELKDFFLQLVPFYSCTEAITKKNIENAIDFCTTDAYFFLLPITIESIQFCRKIYNERYFLKMLSFVGSAMTKKFFIEEFSVYLSNKFEIKNIVLKILQSMDSEILFNFKHGQKIGKTSLNIIKTLTQDVTNLATVKKISKTITPEYIENIVRFNKFNGRLRLLGGAETIYAFEYSTLLDKIENLVNKMTTITLTCDNPYCELLANFWKNSKSKINDAKLFFSNIETQGKKSIVVNGDNENFFKCKKILEKFDESLEKINKMTILKKIDESQIEFINGANKIIEKLLNEINENFILNPTSDSVELKKDQLDLLNKIHDVVAFPIVKSGATDDVNTIVKRSGKRPFNSLDLNGDNGQVLNIDYQPSKRIYISKQLPSQLEKIETVLKDYKNVILEFTPKEFEENLNSKPKNVIRSKLVNLFKKINNNESKLKIIYEFIFLKFDSFRNRLDVMNIIDENKIKGFATSIELHVKQNKMEALIDDLTNCLFFKFTKTILIQDFFELKDNVRRALEKLQTELKTQLSDANLQLIGKIKLTTETIETRLNVINSDIMKNVMKNSFNQYKKQLENVNSLIKEMNKMLDAGTTQHITDKLTKLDKLLEPLKNLNAETTPDLLNTAFISQIDKPANNAPHIHYKLPSENEFKLADITIHDKNSQDFVPIKETNDQRNVKEVDLTKWHSLPLENGKRLFLSVKANTIYDVMGIIDYINLNFQSKTTTVLTGVHGSKFGDGQWISSGGVKSLDGEKITMEMLNNRFQLASKYPNVKQVIDVAGMTEQDFINSIVGAETQNVVITYCYSLNDEVLRRLMGRGNSILSTYQEKASIFQSCKKIISEILSQPENNQLRYLNHFMNQALPSLDYLKTNLHEILNNVEEERKFTELLKVFDK